MQLGGIKHHWEDGKEQTCIALHKCLLLLGEKVATVPLASTACMDVTCSKMQSTVEGARLNTFTITVLSYVYGTNVLSVAQHLYVCTTVNKNRRLCMSVTMQ